MEPPDEEVGYWADGIAVDEACPDAPLMVESAENGWKGDVETLIGEKRNLIAELSTAGVPLIVVPHPTELLHGGTVTHDVEYMRDPFIADEKSGRALLFDMGEKTRRREREFYEKLFDILGVSSVDSRSGHNEGGNTRRFWVDGETLLISAASTRTQISALYEKAAFLDIPFSHQVILEIQNGTTFHLDCALTGVVGRDRMNIYAWMDAFTEESRRKIEDVVKRLDAGFYPLGKEDTDNLTINQLQVNGHVFASSRFSCDKAWQSLHDLEGVKVVHTPLTQNIRTNGQTHCLTNELWLPEPIDVDSVNEQIEQFSDIFPPSSEVKVFNNYS